MENLILKFPKNQSSDTTYIEKYRQKNFIIPVVDDWSHDQESPKAQARRACLSTNLADGQTGSKRAPIEAR